ncbi:MAG: hypothetical protein SGJ18_15565 [Pseudomonadota bacterium]|nr:hypothetical protein [Pseudomonadota bacterium]
MKTIFVILALGFSQNTSAQSASGAGYFGFAYGLSVPDAQNTVDHRLSGVIGGGKVSETTSFGGYHLESTSEDGPNSTKFNYGITGLEGRLNLTTGEKQVYIGIRTGVAKINTAISGNTVVFSPYHWGIMGGYSYNIYWRLNFGIEGSYIAFERSQTSSAGTEVELQPFHIINFLAMMTVAF